jgi:hypothetical protein
MIFRSARKLVFLAATLSLLLPLLMATSLVNGAQKRAKLEKSYREWLERDVTYIITKDERDEFLRLTTDEARDKFISDFWEVRNTESGARAIHTKMKSRRAQRALLFLLMSTFGSSPR